MPTLGQLRDRLGALDNKSYGAYKQLRGAWANDRVELCIDHVQGDPFATPSRVRLRLPAHVHGLPGELRSTPLRTIGLTDVLLRIFASAVRSVEGRSGSGKSGAILVDEGGAEILSRSGCGFDGDVLELRFRVGLPARGRRILGQTAAKLLADDLPDAAESVTWERLDQDRVWRFIHTVEDHAALQSALCQRGLVAFLADGSILPRRTGISAEPLQEAVPLQAPDDLAVELETPHGGVVRGMGIPAGVTLVTGGGFHGKTTLLEAIQHGVMPHVPGDGRERVATVHEAVKVRSEDGRSVVGVDLSGFIRDLPGDRETENFHSPDASGSTSLAAGIIEALEVGARVLLLDEDTCATNLLIRDARMQALVQHETITPLIDRVRELTTERGVSTILVVGGSGDYLEVADTVILMDAYLPREVSQRAREVVAQHPTGRRVLDVGEPLAVRARSPRVASLDPARARKTKVRARGLAELRYGDETLDLSALEQLVDDSQARTIGVLLEWIGRHGLQGHTVSQLLDDVLEVAEHQGLYGIAPLPELAWVRRFELAAALNRLRVLEVPAERRPSR